MVVSNDAGSTEYISHLILNEKNYKWIVYVLKDSIAAKIFKKYDIAFDFIVNLEELNDITYENKPSIILYGTGWQVDFSGIVKSICHVNNIKSIALIDHWSNYKERFSEKSFPDTILVMDDLASKIAKKEFNSQVNIVQIRNYFIEFMLSDFSLIENKTLDSIVFISEPTIVNELNLEAYEYLLLKKVLTFFDDVIIRLHPSENRDKYSIIISEFQKVNVSVIMPDEEDLLTTLAKSKLTIGLSSMALYISYLLGINTISCILNSNIKPNIPIPKRYILRDCEDLENVVFSPLSLGNINNNSVEFESIIYHILEGN